ncbi:hypothetical protein [Stutzerimonas stutzeri]|uniref:hypothetical protein n=1 Tax=Stutzerimonas stutzeri TaxID=316 RepID=UPI0014837291|nr:hypothetical protein [Stutzerimonas stutzeri]
MYGQKRNGDPEEIRITVYKNNAEKEDSPQTFGMSKRGKLRYWKASANRKSRG